jgi:hypothetical protein
MAKHNPDPQGYSTKVTFLGKGWGIRILRNDLVIAEDFVKTKRLIGPAIASALRMLDKCGISDMASASRDRNYCDPSGKKLPTYEQLLQQSKM